MAFSVEQVRADVAAALDIDTDEIQPEDSIADHGIDSVRLIALVENWRKQGATADLAAIIEDPTIVGIVDALNS